MNARTKGLTLLTSLACAVAAYGQTSTTSGAVRGTVRSKKGGAVANAKLTLRNLETGFARTTVTDAKGTYVFSFMPVGDYEITATASGLKTGKNAKLRVTLGESATQNFDLDAAEAAAVVEVVAESSAVDATQVNTATSMSQELVEAVPINGRNFTDLVQLTPGAVEAAQTYRTSVEGARGVMNNLQIDGAGFNSKFNGESRGGTRIPFAFSQDSIRELQVINNAFDVQYGDASGAIVNAITKSGTNEVAGSFMALFRPSGLVANIKPVPFDRYGDTNKPSNLQRNFSQSQFGFTIGGPIIKDKLHYFLSAETVRFKLDSIPALSDPATADASNFGIFWNTIAPQIRTSSQGYNLVEEKNRAWTNDIQHTTLFGRVDWTINSNHRATIRLNAQLNSADNDTWDRSKVTNHTESNNAHVDTSSLSWVGELSSVLSPNLVNEARVQFASERRPTTPNSDGMSELNIPGLSAGQYYIDPRGTDEITTQLMDTMTYMKGDWTFKGGFDLQFISYKNTFFPNRNGSWTFKYWDTPVAWWNGVAPSSAGSITYTQTYSPQGGRAVFDEKFFGGFLQAQYAGLLGRRLNLTLGLRYNREMWDDNPLSNPKVQGLDQMPDNGAWDPRFGFTFDVFGDSRTVIRGGYGWFSTSNPAQNVASTIMSNGQNQLPYRIVLSDATAPLFAAGGILSRQQRFQNGILTPLDAATLANLGSYAPNAIDVTLISPKAKMTQSRVASLEVQQDLGNGFVVGARATYKTFRNMQYWENINLAQIDPATGLVDPTAFYNDGYKHDYNKFSTTPSYRPGRAIVDGRLLDLSGYGNVGLSMFDGEGRYKALTLSADRRSRGGFGFKAHVTFSKAEDNNSNERATMSSSSAYATDPTHPLIMARSDNDQAFRAVLTGYLPTFYGFNVSGTTTYTTGRPFTPRYYADINGDGYTNDPAAGGRNSLSQPYRKSFDLRVSRRFPVYRHIKGEAQMDVFNVFNWANQYTGMTVVDDKYGVANPDFRKIDSVDTKTREVQFTLKLRF